MFALTIRVTHSGAQVVEVALHDLALLAEQHLDLGTESVAQAALELVGELQYARLQ